MRIVFLAGNESESPVQAEVASVKRDYFDRLCRLSNLTVVSQEKLPDFLGASVEKYSVRVLPKETQGALVSAAFALGDLSDGEPFIIVPSNSMVPTKHISEFFTLMQSAGRHTGALVFQSNDPRYSYARKDKTNNVVEIVEKRVSGDCALAGIYFFKNPNQFKACVQWALVNNVTTDGKYFISPALNYFIASGIEIGLHEIPTEDYLRFDTDLLAQAAILRWDGFHGKA